MDSKRMDAQMQPSALSSCSTKSMWSIMTGDFFQVHSDAFWITNSTLKTNSKLMFQHEPSYVNEGKTGDCRKHLKDPEVYSWHWYDSLSNCLIDPYKISQRWNTCMQTVTNMYFVGDSHMRGIYLVNIFTPCISDAIGGIIFARFVFVGVTVCVCLALMDELEF